MTKLYVGNLPFSTTEESVRALFSPHGAIDSLLLKTDRTTGPPRRFGFIEMASADAARAIHMLNGTDFGGRALEVTDAQDRDRARFNARGAMRL